LVEVTSERLEEALGYSLAEMEDETQIVLLAKVKAEAMVDALAHMVEA